MKGVLNNPSDDDNTLIRIEKIKAGLYLKLSKTATFKYINFNNSNIIIIFTKNISINKMEAKFIGKAKLTKQGQLTLPQEARKDLKIGAESDVYWYELNDVLLVVKEIINPKDILNLILKKRQRKL